MSALGSQVAILWQYSLACRYTQSGIAWHLGSSEGGSFRAEKRSSGSLDLPTLALVTLTLPMQETTTGMLRSRAVRRMEPSMSATSRAGWASGRAAGPSAAARKAPARAPTRRRLMQRSPSRRCADRGTCLQADTVTSFLAADVGTWPGSSAGVLDHEPPREAGDTVDLVIG